MMAYKAPEAGSDDLQMNEADEIHERLALHAASLNWRSHMPHPLRMYGLLKTAK